MYSDFHHELRYTVFHEAQLLRLYRLSCPKTIAQVASGHHQVRDIVMQYLNYQLQTDNP